MAVSLQDIANEINSFSKSYKEQIQQLKHELHSRVEDSDKERKKLGESLTSKTAEMSAESKEIFDRINERINALTDLVDRHRLDNLKSAFASENANIKDPGYKAFIKAIRRGGSHEALTDEEKSYTFQHFMPHERKTLYASEATSGGFFAHPAFLRELQQYQTLISPIRRICRVQMTGANEIEVPRLTGDIDAAWAIENEDFSNSADPVFGIQKIPTHELRGLLKVSQQNLEDSEFDLQGFIRERLGIAFAKKEGTAFVTGDGVGKPRGILNYPIKASSSYSGGSAGKNNVMDAIPYVPSKIAANLDADSVLNVLMDLKSDYEPNASYAMTRFTLNSLRLLKDANGQPLWTPFGMGSTPREIYGRPVIEVPDMDEIAANKYPILVGDFSKYMIVDRLSMAVKRLDELYAVSGLIAFIARKRTGGDVTVPEAFRVLKISLT